MARYIDVDFVEYLIDHYGGMVTWNKKEILGEIKKMVQIHSTTDVAPKSEGEWASDRADYVCTCCGTSYRDDILFIQAGEIKLPNYCPDCGAKMSRSEEAAP